MDHEYGKCIATQSPNRQLEKTSVARPTGSSNKHVDVLVDRNESA